MAFFAPFRSKAEKICWAIEFDVGLEKLMGSNYVVAIGVGNCDKLNVRAGTMKTRP